MNEATLNFTAENFRELFTHAIFQYLAQNGVNVSSLEEVFSRYEEEKMSHSIDLAMTMVIERIVDQLLLVNGVLTEEQLGTEIESDFRIEADSSGKPAIRSNYKLKYEEKNLQFIFKCQIGLDELDDHVKLKPFIEKMISEARTQITR